MSLRSVARLSGGQAARSFASAAEVNVKSPLSGLAPVARDRAEQLSANWKGTSASGENTKNFIGGQFVESKAEKFTDVLDPVSNGSSALLGMHIDCGASSLHKRFSREYQRRQVQNSTRPWKLLPRHIRLGAEQVF